MLGVYIENKLHFNLHVDIISKSKLNQLNALVRLKRYLGHEERCVLVNSFIYSNFNYFPLVLMFSSKRSLNKMENLQKRALRFILDDYTSSYELLLEKSGKSIINLERKRLLCIEVFKTLNSVNPCFMFYATSPDFQLLCFGKFVGNISKDYLTHLLLTD